MMPLIMPPQDGIHSMIENAMPSVCVQSGSAVQCRWCGPAQMYRKISDQKCTIDSRYE